MNVLKSKKAIDYSVLMVIVVLIVLIYLSTLLLAKVNKFEGAIGREQVTILNAVYDSQKLQLFTQLAGRYAVAQAILDLSEHSGLSNSDCGVYNNVPFWNKDPEPVVLCEINVYDSIKPFIQKRLSSFHEQKKLVRNKYEFYVSDNRVVGIALKPNIIELTTNKKFGQYAHNLGFDVSLPTHFELYEPVKNYAQNVVNDCTYKNNQTELLNCIKQIPTSKLSDQGIILVHAPVTEEIIVFGVRTSWKPDYAKETLNWQFALKLPLKIEE